jgi:hypothetical protein
VDQPEEVGFAVELFLEAGAESSGADNIATTVSFMMSAMVYGAACLVRVQVSLNLLDHELFRK